MTNLTAGEREMLRSLKGNTFIRENGDTTWSCALHDSDVVVEEARRGGLISALERKGLLSVSEHEPGMNIVVMTNAGLKAFELV